MLLEGKNAIVYGAGGAVGSAVAHAFARAGASVYLTGRTRERVDCVAAEILSTGGVARAEEVDALDEQSVDEHAEAVVAAAGSIDISFNAVGMDQMEIGVPLVDLSPAQFLLPLDTWARTHFLTSTAAARQMMPAGAGVILTLSSSVARMPAAMAGGFLGACNVVESLSQQLAAELGSYGIRVVCLRPAGILESVEHGSITGEVWGRAVARMGMTLEEYLANPQGEELLPHSVTLANVADVATFMASERAGAMTATVANVSCGAVMG